ncbi:hypothetical protein [Lacinutrix himadriensis]|uniref:hypothetical protein n=1 Tax=Lacinutrix himadriensis TaxID=641549 RepID=UPI0006E46974|nr:hypothetical protein [Lacinutrix himadriensis]
MNKLLISIALLLLLSISFTSCREVKEKSDGAAEAIEEYPVEAIEYPVEAIEEAVENTIGNPIDTSNENTVINSGGVAQDTMLIKSDDFKVILSVDSTIHKNETGILQVWIGASNIEASFPEGMVQDQTMVPSTIGSYAKITPVAPDFDVEYLTEDKCHKIHPSGSDVRFLIKPKMPGTYKVSANVEIYRTNDCNGASVPKTSKTLSVIVDVDTKKEISKKLQELLNIIWEKFLSFWGALIALVFAALLFAIKRRIKKKTDFDETE